MSQDNHRGVETTFISFAPCRVGQHAVIAWMMDQLSLQGRVSFYNNLRLPVPKIGGRVKCSCRIQVEEGEDIESYIEHDKIIEIDINDGARYRIFSFEDPVIKDFSLKDLMEKIEGSGIACGRIRYLTILRDPYNYAASHIMSFLGNFKNGAEVWMKIASEVIGESQHLPSGSLHINYNKWKDDGAYRDDLRKIIGAEGLSDNRLRQVAAAGHGSSFSSLEMGTRLNPTVVDRRWLLTKADPLWQEFINVRTDNISRKVFGFALDDLLKKEGVSPGPGPYISIQHPRVDAFSPKSSPSRVNDFVKFLQNTPLGDYEWHTKVPATPEMRMVDGWENVFQGRFEGRGVVICAGGGTYMSVAWILVNRLRALGCDLPVQIWHKNYRWGTEAPGYYRRPFLEKFSDISFINGSEVRTQVPMVNFGGWEMKSFAMLNSNFREVIYLDADNIPMIDLSELFESSHYRDTGALFWPDRGHLMRDREFHQYMDIEWRKGDPEWESGQMVVNKERHWQPLQLAVWMNSFSSWWYRHFHGDKETFHLAWRKLNASYTMHPPMKDLRGWDCICQHSMSGERIFQHRNGAKFRLNGKNPSIPGFVGQEECEQLLKEYKAKVLEKGPLIP